MKKILLILISIFNGASLLSDDADLWIFPYKEYVDGYTFFSRLSTNSPYRNSTRGPLVELQGCILRGLDQEELNRRNDVIREEYERLSRLENPTEEDRKEFDLYQAMRSQFVVGSVDELDRIFQQQTEGSEWSAGVNDGVDSLLENVEDSEYSYESENSED